MPIIGCGANPFAERSIYNSLNASTATIAKKMVKYGEPRMTIQIMNGIPIRPMIMRFASVLMK
jgi:hypothetical protein